MNLLLFDCNIDVVNAFREYFSDIPNIQIEHEFLHRLQQYDCIVSPANSFGLMDGGIDKHIIEQFGKELMFRVQQRIIDEYAGEQPVGTSFIIETKNEQHPYLAHVPTMRVPSFINRTDNVYQAMKSMLLSIKLFNKNEEIIKTVACSGLGTTTGRVHPLVAARQMRLAYDHVNNPPSQIDWLFAMNRDLEIQSV